MLRYWEVSISDIILAMPFISCKKVFLYRIQDLKKGSRALFGDVTEDHICILIDVSQSMIYKLPVVKEKIYQLIRVSEQLFW